MVRFQSILVSVTEACNVGCAHCGFIGSTRDREPGAEQFIEWVGQACDYGVPVIIFTGGEPFERFHVLRAGVVTAAEKGATVSTFTSSYWATSLDAAVDTLGQLPGLRQLYLSSDVYHQRRVPFERVHHAIAAADRCSIPLITICITYANDQDRKTVRAEYERYGDRVRFYEERVIPTPFMGSLLRNQDPMTPALGCNHLSRCWLGTPIINPNGDLFACHAGKVGAHGDMRELPYWLGNLQEQSFDAIMQKAGRRNDYQYLRTHGPKGVAELYELNPKIAAAVGRSAFSSPCDMCFSALSTPEGRTTLRRHASQPEVVTQTQILLAAGLGELAEELVAETEPGHA